MRVIHEQGSYRIVELSDKTFDIEDLKGETYCPKANADIPADQLKSEEESFEADIYNYGVYGYALERWNKSIGAGWEHVDSCFGFIGYYEPSNEKFNHYIVDELKAQIKKK